MSLLPSRLHVSSDPAEPRVLDIDGEEAEVAFDALGSETARAVLSSVYEEPKTPPEVQDTVGTSLQNVHYHLERLEAAGLIEPAGMGYSAKGNEMTVFGPASEAVVLFAGGDGDGSRLRSVLERVFGLFLVVTAATAVFAAVRRWTTRPEPTTEDVEIATEPAPEAADGTAGVLASLDPVVAFFLGGCAVVVALGLWWLLTQRR